MKWGGREELSINSTNCLQFSYINNTIIRWEKCRWGEVKHSLAILSGYTTAAGLINI